MRPIKLLSISLCLLLAAFLLISPAAAQIKIGTNGATIAPSSLLELESANQGLLLPRMADTVAINALNPPNGMLIYLTKAPAAGLYVRKVTGWEYLTGSLGGNGNFNSLTVAGSVTAVNFSGNLTGNATTATTATTATNSINSAVTNDIVNPAVTYPVFVNSTPGNQPLRTSSGNLSYVPATGILTARGFIGPLTGDVTGNATSSVDAQNTVNMRITDDLVTPVTMYPTFVSGTAGPLPPRVSSARLSFIPLTGELTASTFRGALLGNATSATSVTGNVAAVNGGTGQSIYTPGDILYASTSSALSKLPIGVAGRVLRVSTGNLPAWETAGAGTVINVSGTANRIAVTNNDNTVSPILDIASTYIGQNSITTLGTVSTGVWNGTPLTAMYGGTGLNTLPLGRVLVGNGTGTVNSVDGDVPDLVLTSNGPGLAPTFKAPGVGDMVLSVNQTVTGIKTFGDVGNVGKLVLAGNTSGTTTLNGPAVGSNGVVTLPDQGVLVSENGTQTLLNKTLNSPSLVSPTLGVATGTSLSLGGGSTLITTNQTGTGNLVMSSTPTISGAILNGTTTAATITSPGTITATGGFIGTASNTSNVGALTAAAVETGVNLASNSSTTAVNTIVRRNASGDFSAGTITANLTGNASTATQLATLRDIFGHGFNGTAALTGVILGTYGGTGVDNGTRTITLGGNLTTSGANAIILTTAGATNVILPTTGTLYGTASGSFNSSSLRTSLTDPTGTGGSVFATNPTMERPIASSLLADPGATYNTTSGSPGTNVTATSVSGTNLAGTVTITLLGGGAANNSLVTVSYSVQFPTGSYPVLYPANAAAAALGGTGLANQVFATGSQTGFTISSGNAAVPDGTYTWNYQVIGR